MSRKHIVPGELVYAHLVTHDDTFRKVGHITRCGLVIGVDYARDGNTHHGCEERIKVFWSRDQTFSMSCDCELLTMADWSGGEA